MVIRRIRKGTLAALWLDGIIPDRYRLMRELRSASSHGSRDRCVSGAYSPDLDPVENQELKIADNDAMYCELVKLRLREMPKSQCGSTPPGIMTCYLIPPTIRPRLSMLSSDLRQGTYRPGKLELLRFGPLHGLGAKRKVRYRQLVACYAHDESPGMETHLRSCLVETCFCSSQYYPSRYARVFDSEIRTVLGRVCEDYALWDRTGDSSLVKWFERRQYRISLF